MELRRLTAYALEKYQIRELHKWADFPGFSVLCHPRTEKWLALLMRQYDEQTGEIIERCDLKCGKDVLSKYHEACLGLPFRMKGGRWIGITLNETAKEEIIFRLFDEAVRKEEAYGYTVVLSSLTEQEDRQHQETVIPFGKSRFEVTRETVPEKLWQMRRLYRYTAMSSKQRAECFYKQALFMKDYEDEYPWEGDFHSYFPVYQDLNTKQLRAYFSWRTHLRKGEYTAIPASAAYIYIYELLNGIGVSSAQDVIVKIRAFEKDYLDSGIGDPKMRANLHRWMLEYAVLNGLPSEVTRSVADEETMKRDTSIGILKNAGSHTDEEVFDALSYLGRRKLEKSVVLKKDPERGKRLFADAWRKACELKIDGVDLFALCFGEARPYPWYPLSNAVYHKKEKTEDLDYVLNDCRTYRCRSGIWQMESFERPYADKEKLQDFLKGCDVLFRFYLKTGHEIKTDEAIAWVAPFAEAAMEEDRRKQAEASLAKVVIDLSGLHKIREDAEVTKESLLSGEEEEENEDEVSVGQEPVRERDDLPLDPLQIKVLRALLKKEDVSKIIAEGHLMASILADGINEALFDEFEDTVLLCEDGKLMIVEDYSDDLKRYLGGFDDE
ncbi:MAG: TerB N-terminal domain-containing protein [Erysipelotrichaceae bacterium]|nr:TerB N-terminal domain-containing protein [Erysipelotrichaceae bacterium]